MAMEWSLPRAVPGEKLVSIGTAFVTGMVNGSIARANPVAGRVTTVLTVLGAGLGSLVTKGMLAEVLEGATAGAVGTLGYLTPFMFTAGAVRGRKIASGRTALPSGVAQAIKALAPGVSVGGATEEERIPSVPIPVRYE